MGFLDRICNILEKLVKIDCLAELNESEPKLEVNQDKRKEREVIELDNDRKETEKARNAMKRVEEGNEKRISDSLILS